MRKSGGHLRHRVERSRGGSEQSQQRRSSLSIRGLFPLPPAVAAVACGAEDYKQPCLMRIRSQI
uniref:Uncharacterized protein n=1 Tax=Oryza glumipatula TaxID=40148 RepID=A0A0E0AVS3_9ORYZ